MAGCTISVFSQRPSSPKAYSPDAHTRSPHTTAIWLEIQADRSRYVGRTSTYSSFILFLVRYRVTEC
ncbi:hypothetical protein C8J57DRAFT_1718424 [Mycena rebaudengoi]|nr:hypothetical protein C8J57DRAFT_1718424 [Mycena rebaudengoi]